MITLRVKSRQLRAISNRCRKPADSYFSYDCKRLSLLGSLINGIVVVVGSSWVVPRLFNPEMPMTEGMLALSIFGIAMNGIAEEIENKLTNIPEFKYFHHLHL